LEIEAGAKRRLADEYDAAQERGEVPAHGGARRGANFKIGDSKLEEIPADQLHEARKIHDAEEREPGIVRRALDEALDAGEEPTKAKVKRAVLEVARPSSAARPAPMLGGLIQRVGNKLASWGLVISALPSAAPQQKPEAGTGSSLPAGAVFL
jgi:hypothetical protein